MLFNRMVNIIFSLFLMMRFGYKQDCLDRAKLNTCSREKSPFFKCSKIVVRRKRRSLLRSLEIFMLDRSAKLFVYPFHLNYTGFPIIFRKIIFWRQSRQSLNYTQSLFSEYTCSNISKYEHGALIKALLATVEVSLKNYRTN